MPTQIKLDAVEQIYLEIFPSTICIYFAMTRNRAPEDEVYPVVKMFRNILAFESGTALRIPDAGVSPP